jgi:hypothetical protein
MAAEILSCEAREIVELFFEREEEKKEEEETKASASPNMYIASYAY